MNITLQKILADAKVGKAEFESGDYYVCSEGTLKTVLKSVVDACAEKARNHTLKSNGIPEDYNGYTNVEKEIRKLYENSN